MAKCMQSAKSIPKNFSELLVLERNKTALKLAKQQVMDLKSRQRVSVPDREDARTARRMDCAT